MCRKCHKDRGHRRLAPKPASDQPKLPTSEFAANQPIQLDPLGLKFWAKEFKRNKQDLWKVKGLTKFLNVWLSTPLEGTKHQRGMVRKSMRT